MFVPLFTAGVEFAFLEVFPLFLYDCTEITGQAIDADFLISAEFPPQKEARIELPCLSDTSFKIAFGFPASSDTGPSCITFDRRLCFSRRENGVHKISIALRKGRELFAFRPVFAALRASP